MLNALSHPKKNELIMELWEENQRLSAENKALKGQVSCDETPKKTSKNSSIPPSKDQKPNKKPSSLFKQVKERLDPEVERKHHLSISV